MPTSMNINLNKLVTEMDILNSLIDDFYLFCKKPVQLIKFCSMPTSMDINLQVTNSDI